MSSAQNHRAFRGHHRAVHPGYQHLKVVSRLPQALSYCPTGSNLASRESKSKLTALPDAADHKSNYGQSPTSLREQIRSPDLNGVVWPKDYYVVTDMRQEGAKDPGSGRSPPCSPFFQNPETCGKMVHPP